MIQSFNPSVIQLIAQLHRASKSQIRASILKDQDKTRLVQSLPESGKLKVYCGHTTFNAKKILFLFGASKNILFGQVFFYVKFVLARMYTTLQRFLKQIFLELTSFLFDNDYLHQFTWLFPT